MNKEYLKTISSIIKTGHWITDMVGIILKEYSITEPQYNVLRILKTQKSNPLTVQEIQSQMVQRTSNVTRIIDKLLLKKLVRRQECQTNRRKMDITITGEGIKFLDILDEKVYSFHEPMSVNLSEKELINLRNLIKKLRGDK